MTEHQVAVVVFASVHAATKDDARLIAEQAVRQVIHGASLGPAEWGGWTIPCRPIGVPVVVHHVLELSYANYNGHLACEVTGNAYRKDGHA